MPQPAPQTLFRPTVLLALALMAIIAMMVLPVPAIVLDIGLALSFALAILIFTTTLFIERPLDFSSFPLILLASLMLRLALNVSSTKLIIGQGHTGTDAAGEVIQGFAMFIMSGSIIIGLVIFTVLLIVNFIVITKGAGRMAEVSARFALDAMPGKQLAIDSDVNAGAIGGENVEAVADGGDIADLGRIAPAGRLELEREGGVGESVVGQGAAALGEFRYGEAGFVLEELQRVGDAGDGVVIGRPFIRGGQPPGVSAFFEFHRLPGAIGARERLDRGDLGAVDAPAGLEVFQFVDARFVVEINIREQDDVEEEEDDGDFGAHGRKRSAISCQQIAKQA